MGKTDLESVAEELQALKKLMVIDLVAKGHTQADIAQTLGIGKSTVSEMFPKGVLSRARDISKATR